MTFPAAPADKRELMDRMQAQAPELAADIAALRAQFPKARLVYLQLGAEQYGTRSPEGVVPAISRSADETVERREQRRLAKRASEARKRKR